MGSDTTKFIDIIGKHLQRTIGDNRARNFDYKDYLSNCSEEMPFQYYFLLKVMMTAIMMNFMIYLSINKNKKYAYSSLVHI